MEMTGGGDGEYTVDPVARWPPSLCCARVRDDCDDVSGNASARHHGKLYPGYTKAVATVTHLKHARVAAWQATSGGYRATCCFLPN